MSRPVVPIRLERRLLPNGLTIVLAPDPAVPIVAVNLWYGVGSRNEREGRTGLAHLFEHMMFQGSANVPKGRHFELLEAAGGSMNASTWFDRTNYFETLPAHELDLALWLESDRMGWLLPAMDQEKLDNQRDVVRNERRERYENQPYGDWDERMQALLYPRDHPYHHTVIGSMADLAAASLEDVEAFFRTFYQPGNAVLTIAGDFEPTDAFSRVERYFGEIPAGPPLPGVPGRTTLEPALRARVREEVVGAVPLPRVYMGLRIPAYTDPGFQAADLTSSLLADGRASRLYRRLVRERRIAKDVVAYAAPLVTGCSFILLWATGLPDTNAEELERALEEELEALTEVSPEEVERAVTRSETQLALDLEQLASRADQLSMHQTIFGDAAHLLTEIERLRQVTAGDVSEFTRAFLGPENRAVLTYLPEGRP